MRDPRHGFRHAGISPVAEARSRAGATLAAIRRGEDTPRDPAETVFEAVFERYRRLRKAGSGVIERAMADRRLSNDCDRVDPGQEANAPTLP